MNEYHEQQRQQLRHNHPAEELLLEHLSAALEACEVINSVHDSTHTEDHHCGVCYDVVWGLRYQLETFISFLHCNLWPPARGGSVSRLEEDGQETFRRELAQRLAEVPDAKRGRQELLRELAAYQEEAGAGAAEPGPVVVTINPFRGRAG